ncbi:MAG: GNAT family N-acetyltransferase [Flavobacteriales bacterium]|nr:GNAT family N-acetyltransferase [Flavobacteriales bacterium]
MDVSIRKAEKKDMVSVLELIRELAIYEKEEAQVKNTVTDLERDAFDEKSLFHIVLAERESEIAGMVFYYYGYSTWKGKMLYIDDIVVKERFRRFGIGQTLFDYMRQVARKENANQIRFHVLNWNEPAINFYKKNGVAMDDAWIQCKLEKEDI